MFVDYSAFRGGGGGGGASVLQNMCTTVLKKTDRRLCISVKSTCNGIRSPGCELGVFVDIPVMISSEVARKVRFLYIYFLKCCPLLVSPISTLVRVEQSSGL